MARKPRFPDVDWYCDQCGAYLNSQKGFDDHKYIWKCKKCGFKNSISWNNINREDSIVLQYLLHLIGFISYVGFWTAIMLAISMFVFHADRQIYLIPFFCSLGLYVFAFVISILIEFGVRHSQLSIKNLIFVIFRNLKEDLICPFMYLKELVSNFGASVPWVGI